jgi:hypothetical protein
MRLVLTSAFVASAIAIGTFGVAQGASSTLPATPTEKLSTGASLLRHSLPTTYKSWATQAQSVTICREMRSMPTKTWADCLVGHYEAKTGYRLNEYEFTANKVKNTFKVTYSKITLPKGGRALKKVEKESRKLPTSVYFKTYGLDNGSLILGSNGSSYQE